MHHLLFINERERENTMNPATPTVSVPTTSKEEDLVFAVRPEIAAMEYANFANMDAKAICEKIGLKHSNNVVLFVTKTHTYKSVALRNFAITVAAYFNPSLGYAYPSQARLSFELGATRQTISKWTKELAESGYWAIERGFEGRANRFTFTFAEFAHIRAFMSSERQGEQYIKGLFRTVVSESKRGTTREVRPLSDLPEAMPERDHPEQIPQYQPPVVTDDELLSVVQNIVQAGLCRKEPKAMSKVKRALTNERRSNPTLHASELESVAAKKLTDRIAVGLWTDHDPARMKELLNQNAAPSLEIDVWDQ
jgi:hypothetical protein